ncbi:hypothetical protein V1289_005750 [Bradyrhizobium sp. AZCC 2289]
MCGGSSRRSYKINTCFDALVHCSECHAARAMEIKAIQPGHVAGDTFKPMPPAMIRLRPVDAQTMDPLG